MAWPTKKAGTDYVDSDNDPIWRARIDINQNIQNVNSIIDSFDIASPNNLDYLAYDTASESFQAQQNLDGYIALLDLDNLPDTSDSVGGYVQDYAGSIAITAGSELNLTTSNDSAGRKLLNIPAGTYVLTPTNLMTTIGPAIIRLRDNDTNDELVILSNYQLVNEGNLRFMTYGGAFNLTADTKTYFTFQNITGDGSTTSVPQLKLRRIG
jgi:hypothetical protein